MVFMLLLLPLVTGCWGGTPPAVIAAAQAESDMLDSYKSFVDEVLTIAYDDLDTAINEQIEIILDYELQLQATGDSIAVANVQALLKAYRAKRVETGARLKAIRGQLKMAETTMLQAKQLHAKMLSYLAREQVEVSDFKDLLAQIKGAYEGVK